MKIILAVVIGLIGGILLFYGVAMHEVDMKIKSHYPTAPTIETIPPYCSSDNVLPESDLYYWRNMGPYYEGNLELQWSQNYSGDR